MKITPKFQTGGEVVDPNAAPEEVAVVAEEPQQGAAEAQPAQSGQEQDPIMILAQMSMQALQSQDCNMAMQVCQAFIQIIQQMQGAPQEQGAPVYRKGGRLAYRQ